MMILIFKKEQNVRKVFFRKKKYQRRIHTDASHLKSLSKKYVSLPLSSSSHFKITTNLVTTYTIETTSTTTLLLLYTAEMVDYIVVFLLAPPKTLAFFFRETKIVCLC